MMRTLADLIKDLERLGEARVKADFLDGKYKPPAYETVKEWLSSKESQREEVRAEESLSNSRMALHIARSANRLAMSAIIIAVIAVVVTIAIAWFQRK